GAPSSEHPHLDLLARAGALDPRDVEAGPHELALPVPPVPRDLVQPPRAPCSTRGERDLPHEVAEERVDLHAHRAVLGPEVGETHVFPTRAKRIRVAVRPIEERERR